MSYRGGGGGGYNDRDRDNRGYDERGGGGTPDRHNRRGSHHHDEYAGRGDRRRGHGRRRDDDEDRGGYGGRDGGNKRARHEDQRHHHDRRHRYEDGHHSHDRHDRYDDRRGGRHYDDRDRRGGLGGGPGPGDRGGGNHHGYDRDPRDRRGGRGRGSFGGRGGRGGRGRGGGRNSLPDLSGMQTALSNIILANISPGFSFYLYSVKCDDSKGDSIDSRFRRKFLFDIGLWDGLLEDMPRKEKEDLKRVVWFNGSFFFSSRKIPELDPDKLPLKLPASEKAEGDQITVMHMLHYLAPTELQTTLDEDKPNEISFDNRCSNCTRAFADVGSLLQHW